jgi:hypothetical protein
LEKYRDALSIQNISSILDVLNQLQVDVKNEWESWLKLRLPSLTHETIQTLRHTIPTNLHELLDQQSAKLDSILDPTVVFNDLYETDNFGSQDAISILAKWTEEDFLKWFSDSNDSKLLSKLRKFIRINYQSGDLLKIKTTLQSALRKQSKTSFFNELRIKTFFGNLIADSNHEAESNK